MTEPPNLDAIGRLPIELLESILLLVVEDARLCCLELGPSRPCEIYRCGSMDKVLDFRSTSRNFRDASWRALAKVIGDTKFDVASRNSVENLKAISQSEQLARWIQKLTLTCKIARPTFPLDLLYMSELMALDKNNRKPFEEYRPEDLPEDLIREFETVKEQERQWYPETLSVWQDVDLGLFGGVGGTSEPPFLSLRPASNCSLVVTLMGYLRCFTNLDHACYFYQQDIMPARYRELLQFVDNREIDLGCDASERFPRLNAHMGLEIFMGALAASNTNVRTMELGVQTEEPHAFLTGLPIDVVVKACHKVETLVLRNSYHEFDGDGHYGREPRVILTQRTFPTLRSLTIEGSSLNDEDDPRDAPCPLPTAVPSLSHLTIRANFLHTNSILQFLHHYGGHLQDLVFERVGETEFGSVLGVLHALSLERLEIRSGESELWRQYLEQPDGQRNGEMHAKLQGMRRDLLLASAGTVVLDPYFRQALDEHWQ
ncbi:hypothetical protein HBH98_204830 [Parastagonospora nodorum]|nr:hypothetical protein HBI09_191490 [Parastagonospora nodorum]KAH4339473.1 hypothetical protein HBH98_204830 [Parastagonospora nodorum]KAH4362387.1 hypothetical protein HBH97_193190 [Parastagonospora nodorum]KAH4379869.1 hypothetical protein HBH99_200790 [Parastagonospora nodorum]KAH4801225.1 hypothetical protein HBH61_198550 [Parastagonospora nodorum]